MAFGKSIMSRFSDDIEVLDPAYEGLYDSDETELDAFLKIACEGSEPWCADDECDDAIFVDEDEDEDDEDYDEDDDDDDDDDDFLAEDEECCVENAITDATPQEKRRRFFAMVDKNPKFGAEQKKQIKANYDAKHPEGLAASKESATDYAKAMHMIDDYEDEYLAGIVGDEYEYSAYSDDDLDKHAQYAAGLRTGYTRLVEKNMKKLNMFQGDDEADYSADLHTSYSRARESAEEMYSKAEIAFESAVHSLNTGRPTTEYEQMAIETMHEYGDMDIDEGLENCKNALESMLADLESIS